MTPIQFWTQTSAIVIAIIGALVYQTHYIDKRIDDLRDFIRSEIKRLEDRIDRIERPVHRP